MGDSPTAMRGRAVSRPEAGWDTTVFYQSPLLQAYWLAGVYGLSGGRVAALVVRSILGAASGKMACGSPRNLRLFPR